jgi:hypothetical protein
MRKVLVAAVLLVGATGASAESLLEREFNTLLSWVVGEFSNQQQVSRGENALLESPPNAAQAPDLLFPIFARVEAPALGRHVIYLQWPLGL